MGQIPFTPFEQMNNQMQELAIQKAPQPPQVTSKWGPAQTKITQPTMSQIVAQNVQNIQPSNVIEKQKKMSPLATDSLSLRRPFRKKFRMRWSFGKYRFKVFQSPFFRGFNIKIMF